MPAYRYAITDIHGCAKTFRTLIRDVIKLQLEDVLFLLGDYVDRGPDSKGVLDFIFDLQDQGFQVHCLKGNHEEMMLQSLTHEAQYMNWLKHGGRETLKSFGVHEIQEVPAPYFEFIRKLPHYEQMDDYILVHAGLNFRIGDPLSDPTSMLWIRPWDVDVDHQWLNGRIILHGHTPVDQQIIEYQLENAETNSLIDLDNGCFRTEDPGKGQLCAFNLDTRELFFQANLDI